MKEIVIKNPTRIVNLDKVHPTEYVYGLNARVETPDGAFHAVWEHMLQCGCVELSKDGDNELMLCRNAVLIGSLSKYFLDTDEDDWGVEIPVLGETEADAVLKRHGIPNDGYAAFNRLMRDQG